MKKIKIPLISIIITYILTNLLFKIIGFDFIVFHEKFNIFNFFIDFGTWLFVFVIVYFSLKKFLK
ncbi:hypothetical protein BKP37_17125 [Anaerobacillus alkalilacustris]|uniref:Uncharacterized protein n=1 Tax=Anaerobacillus alkalilacustris TaxID=393763 RepID=A0A1S2LHC0_9BACI|nr:hypothetical protein BKP37_17125 [Anaerobacillus alkalilacustris]